MLYFKTAQFVPGKGDAWTYYECDDNRTILRQLTHIPETGETTRVPDPIVTRLYRPEMLQDAASAEFLALWGPA
ncbi:MAG: hypothetical protein H3C30_12520 [Candidatus Hydrogenedentes bacterium]|nr:hypothetical protein [Candidatus Hydrogenedentota bacterium]